MPTQRYVPITQGFNDDPEAWELTDRFGDRSLRLWIEILRIMEETGNNWRLVDNWEITLARKVRQSPANVWSAVGWMLANGWLIAGQGLASGWPAVRQSFASGPPVILKARNYVKFHETRHATKLSTGADKGSPLPILSYPILPKEALKSPLPVDNSKSRDAFKDQIIQAVASIANGNQEKAKSLMGWVNKKHDEMKEEPQVVNFIVAALGRLKLREGNGIEVKSYPHYLDTLYLKVRTEWLQAENQRHKTEPIAPKLKELVSAIGKK